MRVLFIGGTGNISSAVSRLAVAGGIDLYHLNRGQSKTVIQGVHSLKGDIKQFAEVDRLLKNESWDAVVNFIAFTPEDIERDIRLFRGRTKQYVFISSASVYQKPVIQHFITESTPLANPYWDYSQQKIACEERLMQEYRLQGFPAVIVRPSLTYDTVFPVAIGSWDDFTLVDRMRRGQPVVVHGDGTSLWTITHADDFAKGLVGLLGSCQSIGHAFHITSDEVLNWNQIYQAIGAAAGVEAKLIHISSEHIVQVAEKLGDHSMRGNLLGDKSWSVIFNNSKIKRIVPQYQATIPFAQGIRRTLNWFEADTNRMVVRQQNNDLMDALVQSCSWYS